MQAQPIHHAKALYDYTRQTDEEVSFPEETALTVFDTSDPDWVLVGCNGEYGFAPANYIELADGAAPPPPPRPSASYDDSEEEANGVAEAPSPVSAAPPAASGPAAAIAGIMGGRPPSSPPDSRSVSSPPPSMSLPPRPTRQTFTPEVSDEDEGPPPSLPRRPESQALSPPITQYATARESSRDAESPGVKASSPYNRAVQFDRGDEEDEPPVSTPGGYRLYHINEMVSAMGKRKKMPNTLGIDIAKGTILIAPAKSRDGPQQEWTADKLTHYSIEGKHVFMELKRPSKSVDFHAGSKDTANEIVSVLGEMAGAFKAEGLREVIAAGTGTGGQKKGHMVYEFMAQGDDEVTVAEGDEVIILDDTKSEEWWMIRRMKNGKEGVVPSSYVEVTGMMPGSSSHTGINAGLSTVEQNRLEEERLAKEAMRASKAKEEEESERSEVGPGIRPPQRGSSLSQADQSSNVSSQRRKSRHDSKSAGSKSSEFSFHI